MVCLPVQGNNLLVFGLSTCTGEIIHSLKLADYLLVQANKPRCNYNIIDALHIKQVPNFEICYFCPNLGS